MPHFVFEMFAGLEMFCKFLQPKTVVSVLALNCSIFDQGIRTEGSRKFDQGEASTFTVFLEVLAFRNLFFVFLRMTRIALGALLRVFSFHPAFYGAYNLTD